LKAVTEWLLVRERSDRVYIGGTGRCEKIGKDVEKWAVK
jgi:hypothetical protein